MDNKGKEKGILKMEMRPKASPDQKAEMVTQSSLERPPLSPQPSVDRLSVTWAEPASMASSGVNLFHLPSETPCSNEIRFSPSAGDGSEDEDYSASLSAVLRQRRASVRRSRKGRARRPSSPFLADEARSRRRSSVFTTSSGDTAISMDDVQPAVVTQEQIFENIHLHKEVLGSVKQQPLGMRRKLKIVHQAKAYIKRHEGQLQERLAQSKSTRDIYARFSILMTTKWQQVKREAANMSNILIPWELRIKEIESHFGSVVASYFTFLRWLFWVNLVIAFILLVFVIVPECLTANEEQDGQRKTIMEEERQNSTKLLTLWEFEGVLKVSPIFYGYYSNIEKPEYRMPLAYFLTGLVVYIYSFVAILRKMAENSRMSKLSEKEDECIFSWKLFTGWDFMIGNTETAHNRIASVILGFKEALLEEAEKKKDLRNWRIIFLRVFVNICVIILLAVSAYAVVTVVSRSDDKAKSGGWWGDNETTIVVTVISITFPVFFELLGFLEHYHPRKQLRLQLAKIMLLNLLNLYSLIFALFTKIEGMSLQLDALKPTLYSENITEAVAAKLFPTCVEVTVSCLPCDIIYGNPTINPTNKLDITPIITYNHQVKSIPNEKKSNARTYLDSTEKSETLHKIPMAENLIKNDTNETNKSILIGIQELERLRNISKMAELSETNETNTDSGPDDYILVYEDTDNTTKTTTDVVITTAYTKPFNKTINFTNTNSTYNVTSKNVNKLISIDNNISDTSALTEFETTNSVTLQPYLKDNLATEIINSYADMKNFTFDSNAPIFTTESSLTSLYTDSSIISTTTATKTVSKTIKNEFHTDILSTTISDATSQDSLTTNGTDLMTMCPDFSFNCTVQCDELNITQTFFMSNCMIVERKCYEKKCKNESFNAKNSHNVTKNLTADFIFYDAHNVKMYNLTKNTQKRLLTLCWETMFGQELVKLTMMDLVFVVLGTLFMDFFRALFVRYMNQCWCWDLEKKFPEYGDFKIAENILHLINNQGMVWMGMFFSPGLVVLNVFKLVIMMYLRSWAVMTCNVPHEVIFRVSKSNNFYLALLLTMLFLCVLPVGYSIVWVKPSWHCGPFSEYGKIYQILTNNIYKILPKSLNFTLEYITSPAIVIPMLVLLILIIYYLTSLTNSLREANNDLKIQLRRERTEERRKMFQMADRRRTGSAIDNTPYARWKRALPALPFSKSIDSDDRKTIIGDDNNETQKVIKKKGGIFAKIVSMALDTKAQIRKGSKIHFDTSQSNNNADEETDTDFHETLPREVLKIKDITIIKNNEKDKRRIEFKTDSIPDNFYELEQSLKIETEYKTKQEIENKEIKEDIIKNEAKITPGNTKNQDEDSSINIHVVKDNNEYNISVEPNISIIPVITISKTESDEEITQAQRKEKELVQIKDDDKTIEGSSRINHTTDSDVKCLRRQNSIDRTKEHRIKKPEDGYKYQYSL